MIHAVSCRLALLGLVILVAEAPSSATPSAPPTTLRDREPARLSEGPRVALPPTVVPLDRPRADRRPVYVGAAFVMLAVALWWNRQRRDRFDREDRAAATAVRGSRAARRTRTRTRDDDADDLHAAARGDATPEATAPPSDEHSDPDPGQPRQPRRPS